jgi:hypothetical protein
MQNPLLFVSNCLDNKNERIKSKTFLTAELFTMLLLSFATTKIIKIDGRSCTTTCNNVLSNINVKNAY